AGGPVHGLGGLLPWALPRPVPRAAVADPGRSGLSRCDAVTARHDGPSRRSRAVLMGLRRAHAARSAMVHSLQCPRRGERAPAGSARGGGYLWARGLDTVANALSAG